MLSNDYHVTCKKKASQTRKYLKAVQPNEIIIIHRSLLCCDANLLGRNEEFYSYGKSAFWC